MTAPMQTFQRLALGKLTAPPRIQAPGRSFREKIAVWDNKLGSGFLAHTGVVFAEKLSTSTNSLSIILEIRRKPAYA